jgi:hypothetical protein
MKQMLSMLVALILLVPAFAQDRTYVIEELRGEDSKEPSPFSITRVVPLTGGLRIFLSTPDIEQVRRLLDSGALETQLSDHEAETTSNPSISLGKAVWCSQDSEPIYLAYADPLPACEGQLPARMEYYFEVNATLGSGRDLAIGQDPDFLWLIEES